MVSRLTLVVEFPTQEYPTRVFPGRKVLQECYARVSHKRATLEFPTRVSHKPIQPQERRMQDVCPWPSTLGEA